MYKIGTATNPISSIFWWRIAEIGVIFIPVLLTHFVISVLKLKRKLLLIIFYLATLSFLYCNIFTNYFINELYFAFNQFYYILATPLYSIFIGVFVLSVIYILFELGKSYRNTSGIIKSQVKYLFLAFLIGFSGGVSSYFPVYRIEIYPIWNATIFIAVSLVSYAVIRYRFMDIRLVIKRSTIFTLLVLILTAVYSFLIIFLTRTFGDAFGAHSQLITTLIISILIVAGFQPLKTFIQKVTSKFLFKGDYDPQEVVENLSKALSSSLELEHLFDSVKVIVNKTFYPAKDAIVLLDKNQEFYELARADGFSKSEEKELIFTSSDPLVNYFKKSKELIVLQELKRKLEVGYLPEGEIPKKLVERLEKTSGEIFSPLFSKEKLIGIYILGAKKSGDIYTSEDIRLIEIGSAQAAVAIENALLYEKEKNFTITLKEEVAKATQELRAANRRLKRLDEAKSEFISIASHQLRTPLTVIKGYISMMLEGSFGQLTEPEIESLYKVYESNQRLINLVDDLLNISRMESGRMQFKWQNYNIEDVVSSVVAEIRPNAKKKKLYLEFNKPEKRLPKIKMDREKIRQVFMNLVDNAVKYTKQGGVRVTVSQKGKSIILKIADTGMGIDANEMPHLFQKFSRGKGTSQVYTEGTGLGLYVAREIIKAHGGKITAESEGKGKGSTFYIKLPVV